jgi:sporulation protein YlmC with PRC-barrel domain
MLTGILAATTLTTTAAVMPAQAEDYRMSQARDRVMQQEAMRDEVIEVSELMRADVSSGVNPLGRVEHIVLDSNSRSVQYVLFDHGWLPYYKYVNNSYFNYEDFELVRSFGNLTLRVTPGTEPRGPEELRITADEAEYRLVSRVTDSRLETKGERFFEIEDMLVDRDTGRITHFVIGSVEDSFFSPERRAVAADKVMFRNGEFRTTLSYAQIEGRQPYDPGLL